MRCFLACFFVFILLGAVLPFVQAQQDVAILELSSFTWNKTTLNALTITKENESWWQPYFVNISQRAIDQWNQAIQFLAAEYPDYAYLSRVNIVSEVSNQTIPNYDIYISFAETVSTSGQDALGLTTTYPRRNGTIERVEVELSSKSGPIDLTRSDERDVATHELGHALGLGHSNSSVDLMYPYYDLLSTDNAVSTLDLYGLATSFSWIISQEVTQPPPNSIILPSNIPFEYAPITDPTPKGLDDNPLVKSIVIFLSDPYMAIMVVAFISFLIVAVLVYRSVSRRRRSYRY